MSNYPAGGFQGTDILSELSSWFRRCPAYTKGLLYICSIIGLLNVFTGISYSLVLTPDLIVQDHEIWRFFTSPFAFTSFLQLLFGFWVYLPISERLEHRWGTVKTIIDFFWKNILIYLLFVAGAYLLRPIYDFTYLGCYGLWQPFFAHLVQQSLENPNGVTMIWCLPIQIRNKYYPIALWLLFSLISQEFRIDNLFAIFIGYIHFTFLDNAYHSFLDSNRMSRWSRSFIFSWLQNFPTYVSVSGGMFGNNVDYENNNNYQNIDYNNDNRAQSSAFKAFGGQGVTIGGRLDEPLQNS